MTDTATLPRLARPGDIAMHPDHDCAIYVRRRAQVWEPDRFLNIDEDGDEFEDESDEGEWVDDPDGSLVCCYVGDDREFTLDEDEVQDLRVADDDDYCGGCGAIACGWGV